MWAGLFMVKNVQIKDARMLVTLIPVFVHKTASADEIAKILITNPQIRSTYVVDNKLKLVGKITLKKLIKHEFKEYLPHKIVAFTELEFIGKKKAEDLMTPPVYVKDDDTLKSAFEKMCENDLDELPVIDENHQLIGNLGLLELLTILVEKKEQKAGQKCLIIDYCRPFYKPIK